MRVAKSPTIQEQLANMYEKRTTLAKPLNFRGSFGIDINVFLKGVTETVTQLSG